MAAMFKIPVHVLSGFLGSGKTTLLRRLLQGQDQRDTALLVNEFGAVGIDHLLLAEVAPDTVLLPSGCVCCAMRGELQQALLALFERRQRGEVPAFSQVILETTGLADPAPIFATLLHDRQLQHHFRQGAMITLVDSEHAWQQAQHQPEWLEQVTAADWLLLSKTDRVAAGALAPLQDYLQRLNPLAHIAPTSALADGDLSLFSGEPDTHAFQRLRPLPTATPQPDGVRHPATQTCTIEFDRQINWSAFAVWLSMLLHCHGQSILRIKGILKVAESATPVVIQGVQHSLHPPLHLTAWPPGAQRSQVVLIMRGIDPARVQDAFHRFMLSVAATTPVAPPLTET